MRILFAGTPEIAVPSLQLLNDSQHEVVGVLTAPPRAKGRGRSVLPSPVGAQAERLGLPILAFESLKAEARQAVAELQPEILVVAAYGKIFGPKFLQLFSAGGINLHPSLLPRHRGPAPIPATILSGDEFAGLSVQRIALEMDAGDLLQQEKRRLDGSETTASLYSWAAERGAELVLLALDQIAKGVETPRPQNHQDASYCHLIQKQDGCIDWSLSAQEIHRRVRAYNPWPGAFTHFKAARLTIWESCIIDEQEFHSDDAAAASPGTILQIDRTHGILVQTGKGVLSVLHLQLAGKKALDWKSFVNGHSGLSGSVLGGDT